MVSERSVAAAGVFEPSVVAGLLAKCRRTGGENMSNTDNMRTMVVGIGMLSGNENQIANWPYVMVVATVAVVPSLIVFAFGQRYFVQGITLSGLKG